MDVRVEVKGRWGMYGKAALPTGDSGSSSGQANISFQRFKRLLKTFLCSGAEIAAHCD